MSDEPPASTPEPTPPAAPAEKASDGNAAPLEASKDEEIQPASYVLFAVIAILASAADLVTKELATKKLTGPQGALREHIVIKGLFEFRYARNNGGAWSALSDLPEIWRRPFFLFVSTAASVFIMSIYSRIDRRDWAMKWGLPLALGGAVGNLVDRVRHGFVVDFLHAFIEVKGQRKNWPTFNVADVWIVVGVALMALSLFFGRGRLRTSADDEDEEEEDVEGPETSKKSAPPEADPPSAATPTSRGAGAE